jgi:catechol 2,3-dioxygenase-like lactoylglutathione lyase family enzyme
MEINLEKAIPVLRIFDEAKAREFYVDFLGFKVDWEHRFEPGMPLYMQVSRGDFLLHLTEHHGDACPGSAVFVRMSGIKEFHAELTAKKYGYAKPGLVNTPWKTREVSVKDPFGNRLSFNELNRENDDG